MNFIKVTKEEFFAYVGPRDICVHSYANETLFTTRDGRTVVGKTAGYKSDDNYFMLSVNALNEIRKTSTNSA